MRKLTFTRVSGFRRLYETKLRMDMLVAGVLVGGMWASALVPVVVKADSITKVVDTTTTVVADTTSVRDRQSRTDAARASEAPGLLSHTPARCTPA